MFAIKGSRFITHLKQLRDIETPLANFFASGVLRLEEKIGPFLWQFSPGFRFDRERLEHFCALLPRDTEAAVSLAERHDHRLGGRAWTRTERKRRLRHAIEIRHESFVSERFIRLLRRYGVGLVVADTVELPLLMDVTSSFVYCRLHGSKELYASGYEAGDLDVWARRVVAWAGGGEVDDGRKASNRHANKRQRRDVYVYFDNDMKVRAPFDAAQLRDRVTRLLAHPTSL